ncbi:hypothetical protein Y032_0009g737 [Ancylostoma ceylanicum]|uniref:Uncharacterized protein n=1 Tax=Ancylostoma ceylanicum TaxID=53326 RepID=A0A016VJ55_9BILA|nr:hypothetical protein Y032_0009g737 [Ancylostoma ceylanicum]
MQKEKTTRQIGRNAQIKRTKNRRSRKVIADRFCKFSNDEVQAEIEFTVTTIIDATQSLFVSRMPMP